MPIIQSAIKRARQNPVRQARRKPVKTLMKTMVSKLELAVKEGKKDEAMKLIAATYKAIDMAKKQNIIHKNTASRKKSSVAKMVASLK